MKQLTRYLCIIPIVWLACFQSVVAAQAETIPTVEGVYEFNDQQRSKQPVGLRAQLFHGRRHCPDVARDAGAFEGRLLKGDYSLKLIGRLLKCDENRVISCGIGMDQAIHKAGT